MRIIKKKTPGDLPLKSTNLKVARQAFEEVFHIVTKLFSNPANERY